MTVVLDGVQFGAGCGAAAACWWVAGRHLGPARFWRRLLGLGLLGWALGHGVRAALTLADPGTARFPSPADLGLLALPVCVLIAMVAVSGTVPRRAPASPRRERVVLVLDALLVTGSFLALSWSVALGPLLAGVHRPPAATALAVAYPVFDLFLVVLALLLMLARPAAPRLRRPLLLVAAAFVLFGVADGIGVVRFAAGQDRGGVAAAVVAGVAVLLAVLAATTREPAAAAPTARTELAHLLVPYVPVITTGVVIAVRAGAGQTLTALEAYLGWLGLGLVVARQMLTIVDHTVLLARVAEGRLRLMHQAYHDPLTGLANRTLFRERLAHAVDRHRRAQLPLAVLFVDLDDFKLVNDNLGHAVGDRLLRGVGERLVACVRRGDMVARLGGDEFAVLIEGLPGDVEPVGRRILDALREPFLLDGHVLTAGASVGLAMPDGVEQDVSADVLLRRADAAMYAGKRRGKGELVRYAGGARTDLDLPALLARALADSPADAGFEVHYQPVVRLADGVVVAVEALARWRDPEAGVIDPDVFVIVAERTGLVAAIDDFVLDRACADADALAARYGGPLDLHVNVSSGRLGGPELDSAVERALTRHALPPSRLVLEITETRRIPDLRAAAAAADRLRAAGVRLALDDFGSGFNALAQLHGLPVDIVKLDGSLTDVELAPERAGALCRSVLAICAELGVSVVAEGVERPAQAAALAELGCAYGQGYHLGVPQPLTGRRLDAPVTSA